MDRMDKMHNKGKIYYNKDGTCNDSNHNNRSIFYDNTDKVCGNTLVSPD